MAIKELPGSRQEALLESPMYARYSLADREEEALVKLFYGGGTLDAWCPNCSKHSVFRINSQLPGYNEPKKSLPLEGLITVSAFCTRGAADSYSGCRQPLYLMFYKSHDVVRKVGQSPSAADLAFGAMDEALNKELDDDRRAELGRAIGLEASGAGIGSFVYLRRIFEALLEEARQQAAAEASWDEARYRKARIPERIQLLHAHLPSRLVESADLYKVLSLGIHELSEEECLASFDLVQGAIELILKERHETKRFDRVIKAVAKGTPPTE